MKIELGKFYKIKGTTVKYHCKMIAISTSPKGVFRATLTAINKEGIEYRYLNEDMLNVLAEELDENYSLIRHQALKLAGKEWEPWAEEISPLPGEVWETENGHRYYLMAINKKFSDYYQLIGCSLVPDNLEDGSGIFFWNINGEGTPYCESACNLIKKSKNQSHNLILPNQNKWIDIEQMIPDLYINVLIKSKNKNNVTIGCRVSDRWAFIHPLNGDYISIRDVGQWMPIPNFNQEEK